MKVLIISSVWIEPTSSAAGSRMLQLLSIFKNCGWQLIYATTAAHSEYAYDLSLEDVHVHNIKLNDSSFDDFARALQPDIVLFDRFMVEEQFGWRVSECCPKALKMLDTEDLHFLRKARQRAVKDGKHIENSDLFTSEAKREIAAIYRCDLSIMISTYEQTLLEEVFKVPSSLLCYVPFLVDELKEMFLPYDQRAHFIFIGNFIHAPNWDAMLALKQHIWPEIRKELPQVELHIYGSYPSQKVFQLHNPNNGFLIKGRAKEAQDVISRARVMLAPLRFGAGLKGKLIDAMQCGTPSITSNIGVEAMSNGLPWGGAIKNDDHAFAKAAVTIYTDKAIWRKAQLDGFKIINSNFQKSNFEEILIDQITHLLKTLNSHRLNNFTGQMLQHHTLQSTKYMSKWIEEKNK